MIGKVQRFLMVVVVLVLVVPTTWAQISMGGTPRSFSLSQVEVPPTAPLPPVDMAAYLAEDEQAGKDEPFRFGAPYYRVYSATAAEGPYTQFEGGTSNLYFVDTGGVNESQKFYIVRSSTQP